MSGDLPSGRVTFAFVDVVGSTRLFTQHGDRYAVSLADLRARVSRHTTMTGGVIVELEGDGAFLAFPSAEAAVDALRALQGELDAVPTEPVALEVRAGAHTGEAKPVGDGYVALAAHVAARVAGAAGAGQLIVSESTRRDMAGPAGEVLGAYALKDVPEPMTLWRMCGDDTPPRATPARRTNVRTSRTSFAGRANELEELGRAVKAHRLVSIVGPGGVGKTRLVSEWALTEAAEGRIVWMAELATIDAPDQVASAVARACGATATSAAELSTALATRAPFVVVLDNCEHLIDGVVPVVDGLVESCPPVRVVCTSREPLLIAGEFVQRLGPLAAEGAAVELFLERAAAAGADTSALSPSTLAAICTAMDSLPLALELAALQTAAAPPDQLVNLVRDELASLTRRGGEERQRSLSAILDWSLRTLSPGELDALLALSIWPGRFTPDMARTLLGHIASAPSEAVSALVRRNLVDLDGDEYRLLFTIRETARRRLARRVELEAETRRALVTWAIAFARQFYGLDADYAEIPIDEAVAVELALAYERESRNPEIHYVWDLARHLARARHASPALRAEAAATLAEGPPNDLRSALVQGVAVNILSAWTRPVGVPTAHLDAILEVVRDSGPGGVALVQTLGAVAWELEITGRASLARPLRLEFAALVDRDPALAWLRPAARFGMGNNHRQSGAFEQAAEMYAEGLAIGAETNTVAAMNVLHAGLADMLLQLGRPDEALTHALDSVRLTPMPGSGRNYALRLVATAFWRVGDLDSALAVGRELEQTLRAQDPEDAVSQAELEALLRDVPALAPGPS